VVNISFESDDHIAIDLSKSDLQTLMDMGRVACEACPNNYSWKRITDKLAEVWNK
jgi:hypothetical protein